MKVCTVEHDAPGFGVIPVGSLWADDSPHVIDADCFDDVPDAPTPPPVRKQARKFGTKDEAL